MPLAAADRPAPRFFADRLPRLRNSSYSKISIPARILLRFLNTLVHNVARLTRTRDGYACVPVYSTKRRTYGLLICAAGDYKTIGSACVPRNCYVANAYIYYYTSTRFRNLLVVECPHRCHRCDVIFFFWSGYTKPWLSGSFFKPLSINKILSKYS